MMKRKKKYFALSCLCILELHTFEKTQIHPNKHLVAIILEFKSYEGYDNHARFPSPVD